MMMRHVEWIHLADSFENGNMLSDSMKGGEFLH